MTWNYRMCTYMFSYKKKIFENSPGIYNQPDIRLFKITSVYYDKDANPNSWAEKGSACITEAWETPNELRGTVGLLQSALLKPILDLDNFPNEYKEKGKIMKKLTFKDWLDKYFEKDGGHLYYTWTYTDDGMHPDDQTRWSHDDLLNEYERYLNNNKNSHVGLDEYGE